MFKMCNCGNPSYASCDCENDVFGKPCSYDPDPHNDGQECQEGFKSELNNWTFKFLENNDEKIILRVSPKKDSDSEIEYLYDLNQQLLSYDCFNKKVSDNFHVESHAKFLLKNRVIEKLVQNYETDKKVYSVLNWSNDLQSALTNRGLVFIAIPDPNETGLIVFKYELDDDELPF